MRGIGIIIFIFLFIGIILINNSRTLECYQGEYISVNPKILKGNESHSIYFNIEKLKKDLEIMNNMIECIECKKKATICNYDYKFLFGKIEEEISYYEMVCILMESYIDNFLDIYVSRRFNLKTFINIKYQYPNDEYEELNQFYLITKDKINYLNSIVNDGNFDLILFKTISFDLKNESLILQEIYENISNRNNFTLDDVKEIINLINSQYLSSILKYRKTKSLSLEFKYINNKEKLNNDDYPYLYSLKEINEDDIVDVIENLERMIENEINEIDIILNENLK